MASNLMTCLIFLFMSLSLGYSSYSTSPNAITLELIPPHSPKSPLFIPNLTYEERMQMLVTQSHAHVQYLSSLFPNNSLLKDTTPMPIIKKMPISSMLVEVGIGTFNNDAYKSYLLVMDTASKIIWIQCEDCKLKPNAHCYPQKEDIFPNSKSKSYTPFNPPSPYNVAYGDGSYSNGFYAKETFTFSSNSSSSSRLKLPNIVFGCGNDNNIPHQNPLIAGVFGMAMDKTSFINQIETQSGGRFSYCFIRNDVQNPPPMYLKFGSNIKPPRSPKTLNLIKSSTHYAVKMVDLGVNFERIHIDKRLFDSKYANSDGLIVDSGSSTSYLSKGVYDIVVSNLEKHFSKHKEEFTKLNIENKLCYSRIKGEKGYNNIPNVTYYFEGGVQLDVLPEDTFFRIEDSGKPDLFCLGIFPSTTNLNILGAFQQANFKFIFNTKDRTLQFGRENCIQNS